MPETIDLYADDSLAILSYDFEDQEPYDVPFFLEAATEAGGHILELGCGTGRVLIELARAGFAITGIDTSVGMIARCNEKLAEEQPGVRKLVKIKQGDMRNFRFRNKFKLAIFPFGSFQHLLTMEEQLKCLGCLRKCISDSGTVILSLFNPDLNYLTDEDIRNNYQVREPVVLPDGQRIESKIRVRSRDWFLQLVEIEHVYRLAQNPAPITQVVRYQLRYLFRFEIEHLLARCDFAVEHVYGDFERRPYGESYPGELIVVARPC